MRIHFAVCAVHIQTVRLVDLPAQPRMGGGLAVAVAVGVAIFSGIEAAAGCAFHAQRVIHRAAFARKACFHLAGATVARAHSNVGGKSAFAFFGEDLHHARHGIRPIHRCRRAAHNFDALDLPQRNSLPRRTARGLRIDPHAVDIHRRKARISPADIQAAGGAGAAVAHHFQPGLARQQIGYVHCAALFDLLAVDDGNVGQHIGKRLLNAVGRNDYGCNGCAFRIGLLRGSRRSLRLLCRRGLAPGNGRKQAGYGGSQRQGTQRSFHHEYMDKHTRPRCTLGANQTMYAMHWLPCTPVWAGSKKHDARIGLVCLLPRRRPISAGSNPIAAGTHVSGRYPDLQVLVHRLPICAGTAVGTAPA